ncbi:MAG: nucleoside triphosphate pyrophosphohydrolase [Desulfovibrionaceae bacterium]
MSTPKDARNNAENGVEDASTANTGHPDPNKPALQQIDRLRGVIDRLIGPDGCPWDREQTPETLCDYVVEEAFELVEAIRSADAAEASEELGDVLFLLLFIARLYEGRGDFSLEDSVACNAAKMIRRHPHVFGDLEISGQDELLRNWERIKRGEKRDEDGGRKRVFESLPKGLPPLLRAYRIHSKAARAGFTWDEDAALEAQLADEWREWSEAAESGDMEAMAEEYGDYLFTLVELGRRHGIKANAALDLANRKFLERFEAMENQARAKGRDVADCSLDELNKLWEQAKRKG